MDTRLRALLINCTLKPSPASSSTGLLGGHLLDALGQHDVDGHELRVVDHAVLPGVATDMGDGDDWPELRRSVLEADIVVFGTPTWMGQHSSVAQRVLERLDAELSEQDPSGRPILFDKVAIPVVVGNEDGAHHICGILAQALGDVGFTIPAQPSVYWNGAAMQKVDFKDLDGVPDAVQSAIQTAAANAAHLARLLKERPYAS